MMLGITANHLQGADGVPNFFRPQARTGQSLVNHVIPARYPQVIHTCGHPYSTVMPGPVPNLLPGCQQG